jgi:ABC-type multidrug transport system ATPase subunit
MLTPLTFRRVTKRFADGTLALADVDFTVEDRSRTCLLGPRGSGKTTVVRLIEAALQPTGGKVLLWSVPTDSRGFRSVRRQVGVVAESPGAYVDLTAGEYMALARRLYKVPRDRAVGALDLSGYLHTRIDQLSTAFRRRLALAAALVSDPEMLILDEPSQGLEPEEKRELHDVLLRTTEQRTTLLCTEDEEEAKLLCHQPGDRVILLNEGRIVDRGSWDEIRGRARSVLRISAREGPNRLLAEARRLDHQARRDGESVLVELENLKDATPALIAALVEADIHLYECTPLRSAPPPPDSGPEEAGS